MIALAVDADNDLFLGADGNLALATDLQAVLQAAQQAAQTLLAEMVYATDRGVPYFEVAWGGKPNPAQLDAYLRQAFTGVDNVLQVQSLTITGNGDTLSYAAVIQTIYGTGAING